MNQSWVSFSIVKMTHVRIFEKSLERYVVLINNLDILIKLWSIISLA